jgi:hypothetical protein
MGNVSELMWSDLTFTVSRLFIPLPPLSRPCSLIWLLLYYKVSIVPSEKTCAQSIRGSKFQGHVSDMTGALR